MINENKWVNSLPNKNKNLNEESNEADHYRWVSTIPKKDKFDFVKKYSFIAAIFIFGLIFISALKNEGRKLQREIDNLKASLNIINFDINQANLDKQVLTSPDNISKLAEEYLNINLTSYKSSQIKHINDKKEKITEVTKIKKKKLSTNIKKQVSKKIEQKKTEIRKLQELYSNPEAIPDEIKKHVTVTIQEKKTELRDIYSSPSKMFTIERVSRWSVIQVVKLFLGMPVIPGR